MSFSNIPAKASNIENGMLYAIMLYNATGGALLGLIMPNIITSASLFKDAVLRERVLALYTVFLFFELSLVFKSAVVREGLADASAPKRANTRNTSLKLTKSSRYDSIAGKISQHFLTLLYMKAISNDIPFSLP